MELLLEGISDTLDPLEIIIRCPINNIAVKRSDNFGAVSIGTNLEWILALELQKERDLVKYISEMIAGNFIHDRVGWNLVLQVTFEDVESLPD